jgi:Na+/proline symporter
LGIYGRDPNFLPYEVAPSSHFGEAINVLLHGSGATIFTAGIVLLGSLAAIMSTADSAIISCSNVVTIDLIKGWLWPMCNGGVKPNAKQTMIVSKVSSLVVVILGVLITNLDIDLSSLFVLQGVLLCQAIPAYSLALYHPTIMDNSAVAGMAVGVTVDTHTHTHTHTRHTHTHTCTHRRTHTHTHTHTHAHIHRSSPCLSLPAPS